MKKSTTCCIVTGILLAFTLGLVLGLVPFFKTLIDNSNRAKDFISKVENANNNKSLVQTTFASKKLAASENRSSLNPGQPNKKQQFSPSQPEAGRARNININIKRLQDFHLYKNPSFIQRNQEQKLNYPETTTKPAQVEYLEDEPYQGGDTEETGYEEPVNVTALPTIHYKIRHHTTTTEMSEIDEQANEADLDEDLEYTETSTHPDGYFPKKLIPRDNKMFPKTSNVYQANTTVAVSTTTVSTTTTTKPMKVEVNKESLESLLESLREIVKTQKVSSIKTDRKNYKQKNSTKPTTLSSTTTSTATSSTKAATTTVKTTTEMSYIDHHDSYLNEHSNRADKLVAYEMTSTQAYNLERSPVETADSSSESNKLEYGFASKEKERSRLEEALLNYDERYPRQHATSFRHYSKEVGQNEFSRVAEEDN